MVMSYMTQQFPKLLWTLLGNFILSLWGHTPEVNLKKTKQKKNMKLVAGNVFYHFKGRLYLALLLPFQKKSNIFLKKIIQLSSFLIPIKFIPEKTLQLSWSKTNHLSSTIHFILQLKKKYGKPNEHTVPLWRIMKESLIKAWLALSYS